MLIEIYLPSPGSKPAAGVQVYLKPREVQGAFNRAQRADKSFAWGLADVLLDYPGLPPVDRWVDVAVYGKQDLTEELEDILGLPKIVEEANESDSSDHQAGVDVALQGDLEGQERDTDRPDWLHDSEPS